MGVKVNSFERKSSQETPEDNPDEPVNLTGPGSPP